MFGRYDLNKMSILFLLLKIVFQYETAERAKL